MFTLDAEQKEAPDPGKVKLLAAACLPCVPDNISTCLTAGISSWQVAVYIAGLRNARDNPFVFSLCNKVPFLCPVPELESYPYKVSPQSVHRVSRALEWLIFTDLTARSGKERGQDCVCDLGAHCLEGQAL